MARSETPALGKTAFNCARCGAYAKQFWFSTHAKSLGDDKTPSIWTEPELAEHDFAHIEDDNQRKDVLALVKKMAEGLPFFTNSENYVYQDVVNLNASKCFNCKEITLWLHTDVLWPRHGAAPEPNADLPSDILRDYAEAGQILDASPRGAAALLRLAVQKLCVHLGGKGKNIDQDIASLVSAGLDKRVQMALDVVRVVGNNAVHPGTIDLRDDKTTAVNLFGLVNLIADIMISQPKHISDMFGALPEGALKAIEKRDTPKQIGVASKEGSDKEA